ncbi:MAG: putative metal-binding motif-containing protein [Myxococcales bacterium]|nr:putative metal-binding motif-containing protein [Myxococcales bacterium]
MVVWFLMASAWAIDADNDGFTPQQGDCDDNDATINPAATEGVGDNIDQNCDGQEICYRDADNDGTRSTGTVISVDADCVDAFEGQSADLVDCDDANPSRYPGAVEVAGDNVDENCDNRELCYADADNDGARLATTFLTAPGDTSCTGPNEGAQTDPIDCDDNNPAVSPFATEIVGDGFDQNCDMAEICYADADGDHFRSSSTVVSADVDCLDAGEALASQGTDCNDQQWNAPFSSIAACDGPPVCGQAPPYVGDLSPANPGVAGTQNTLDLTSGPAQSVAVFVGSTTLGQTPVPGCPGLSVPFAAPTNLGLRMTNAQGDASLTTGVPAGAAGHDVWTFVVYPATCQTSCASLTEF